MPKAVIALSGGLDSTTALALLLRQGLEVHTFFFDYGSKHNPFELEAVQKIASYYDVPLTVIDVRDVFKHMQSNLLVSGGDIPEGHYEQKNMSLTVVPGRNTIFISILMGIAESIGAEKVVVGIHQGDHAIYPDCREDFFHAMQNAMEFASDRKVTLEAPLLSGSKIDAVEVGLRLNVPYELTRTCYKAQGKACGKCGSCVERLEAFEKNGVSDPVVYDNPDEEIAIITADVLQIIREQFGEKVTENMTLSTTFESIGADSLDSVELLVEIEEKFGLSIPDEDAEKFLTVGHVVEYIRSAR